MIPIVGVCLTYAFGILWGLYLVKKLSIVFFFLFLVMIACWIAWRRKNGNEITIRFSYLFLLGVFFLLGVGYTQIRATDFATRYPAGKCTMQGEILQIIKTGTYHTKYRFRNQEGKNFLCYLPKEIDMPVNTIVLLQGELELPSPQRNDGGFSYDKYCYSQNIYGSIYVSDASAINVIESGKFHFITAIQEHILSVLRQLLPQEQLGILLGMLIGDTSYLSEEVSQAFQKSGITHLLAVSGSNVAYMILATKWLCEKIVGKRISKWMTIGIVILFVFVSGASPSVVRAGLMAILTIVAELLARAPTTYATVATSALLILLYNPFIICDIGFLLSFGGTLGILFFYTKLQKKLTEWGKEHFPRVASSRAFSYGLDMLSVTLAAQIFLLPIMWFYFNEVSLISLLTNLLVGPFTGMITILGLILYAVGMISIPIAKWISYSIYVLISWVIMAAKWCAEVPYGTITLPTITVLEMLLYYFVLYAVVSGVFHSQQKTKFLLLLSTFATLCAWLRFGPHTDIKISMIDVGQGDSLLIRTEQNHFLLIDGGGSENSDYDVGEATLVPYLLNHTNGVIDMMLITHFHEDHAEGCLSVLQKMKVKQIIIGKQPKETSLYQELCQLATEKNVPIRTLVAGDSFSIDHVNGQVLFPKEETKIPEDLNNNSMVVRITYGNQQLLVTGDMEEIAEKELLEDNALSATILKVGHHGSRTSTSQAFLETVNPTIALISCGVDNRFGHPHEEIIKRLEENACQIIRTDQCGEISLWISQKGTLRLQTKLPIFPKE